MAAQDAYSKEQHGLVSLEEVSRVGYRISFPMILGQLNLPWSYN